MAKLSLCMIVRNEEEHLARCLKSVQEAVDEIVIVDTGSEDGTKEIAGKFTDRVYDYIWQDDFAGARNAALSYATQPFVLWLDADDVLDETGCRKLIELKERLDESVDAVMTPYWYAFAPDGRCTLSFERERIVRRAAGFRFEGAVHEAMAVSGNVIYADIVIRHTGEHGEKSNARNLAIYEAQLAGGAKLGARDQYYYARELKNAGQVERAEAAFDAFLQADGWSENRIDACIQRGECLRMLGRRMEAKRSYLLALAEGSPRAEALCAMGACLMEEGETRQAIFYYRAALLCAAPRNSGAFVAPDAYGYVPLMQLCVCYDRMGEHEQAAKMNEQALLLRPGDRAALENRKYFERILHRTQEEQESTGREA